MADESAQIRLPAEAAFMALLPEMDAVPEDELLSPTVDILSAVSTVLGALPRLRPMRGLFAQLPDFDIGRFDRLEQYAKAVHHANALFRIATAPKISIADRANELAQIRDQLLRDAQSLASHKLIDAENLKECKTAVGYKALTGDVAILLAVFKAHWTVIKGRTPVTIELLNDANDRAEELMQAVALKDNPDLNAPGAADRRRRAFTIFVRAYADGRRAVAYFRDEHGDADEIAPSIFAQRGGRRGRPEAAGAAAESAPVRDEPAEPSNGKATIEVDPNGLPITPPFVN